MKSLVIAEKPSVARDIARVLGANQKNGGILRRQKLCSNLGTWTSCNPG